MTSLLDLKIRLVFWLIVSHIMSTVGALLISVIIFVMLMEKSWQSLVTFKLLERTKISPLCPVDRSLDRALPDLDMTTTGRDAFDPKTPQIESTSLGSTCVSGY